MGRITTKPKKSQFVNIQVWVDTKNRLVRTAKKRKEKLSKYVDDLSKVGE